MRRLYQQTWHSGPGNRAFSFPSRRGAENNGSSSVVVLNRLMLEMCRRDARGVRVGATGRCRGQQANGK